jgi:hypothetical protein
MTWLRASSTRTRSAATFRCAGGPPAAISFGPITLISEPIASRYGLRDDRDAHCTLPGSLAHAHAGRLVPLSRPPSPPARKSNPHSARGTAGAKLPATSCLGAFWTPADRARAISSLPASKNLHTSGHTKTSWATSSPTGGDQAHFRRARIARPITQSLSLSDRKLSSSVKWVTRWR